MNARLSTLAGVSRRVSVFLVLSFLLQAASGFALDLARRVEFNVPPQPLASAVIQFSKQADIQVLAAGQKLDGVASKGGQGRHPIDQGLTTRLAGTGRT